MNTVISLVGILAQIGRIWPSAVVCYVSLAVYSFLQPEVRISSFAICSLPFFDSIIILVTLEQA